MDPRGPFRFVHPDLLFAVAAQLLPLRGQEYGMPGNIPIPDPIGCPGRGELPPFFTPTQCLFRPFPLRNVVADPQQAPFPLEQDQVGCDEELTEVPIFHT